MGNWLPGDGPARDVRYLSLPSSPGLKSRLAGFRIPENQDIFSHLAFYRVIRRRLPFLGSSERAPPLTPSATASARPPPGGSAETSDSFSPTESCSAEIRSRRAAARSNSKASAAACISSSSSLMNSSVT